MVEPILAPNSSWFAPSDTTITRSSITEIEIKDTYTPSGTVTAYWDASAAKDGSVMAYVEGTKLTLAGNGYGKVFANPDSSYAFSDTAKNDYYSNLTAVNNANMLDTSKTTTFERTFSYAISLLSLDLSEWDVSNVTNMYYMFGTSTSNGRQPMKLTSIGDVGDWNTANVNTMGVMFQNCSSLETLDVSNWDVGNVTDMHLMFSGCISLETLDVSNWDTGKVTTFTSMFQGSDNAGDMKFTELAVENWNTSSATDMHHMFYGCGQLTEMNLHNWDVSKVTDMNHMFADCYKMERYDFTGWNTDSLVNMNAIFNDNHAITSIDVSDFDTGKVTIFNQVFDDCTNLETIIGLENWDTSNAIYFIETFYGCINLTDLNLSTWNVSKVAYFVDTFANCSSLTELDLSSWDTSSYTAYGLALHGMFRGCSNLETIYVSDKWGIDRLVDGYFPESDETTGLGGKHYQEAIFNGCTKLVGGNGTAYADNHVDYTTAPNDSAYAIIDGKDGKPGYLTNNEVYLIKAKTIFNIAKSVRNKAGITNMLSTNEIIDCIDNLQKVEIILENGILHIS